MKGADRIVLAEGVGVVAATTISSFAQGQGFPAPKVFLGGAAMFGGLVLLARPAPAFAVSLGALVVVYGLLRASKPGGKSVGEILVESVTGIGTGGFEAPGSGKTSQPSSIGGSSAAAAMVTPASAAAPASTGTAPAVGATRSLTPSGTGSGAVFGGGVPVASSDGGAPYASASKAARFPLSAYQAIIGRPYQGTHTNYGNWESDNAVDLQAAAGTPVYAVAAGTIGSQIGPLNSSDPHLLGDRLHLVTADNEFYYQHLKSYVVKPGQTVQAGQLLGYTGALNHLHFAAKNGSPLQILGLS